MDWFDVMQCFQRLVFKVSKINTTKLYDMICMNSGIFYIFKILKKINKMDVSYFSIYVPPGAK